MLYILLGKCDKYFELKDHIFNLKKMKDRNLGTMSLFFKIYTHTLTLDLEHVQCKYKLGKNIIPGRNYRRWAKKYISNAIVKIECKFDVAWKNIIMK